MRSAPQLLRALVLLLLAAALLLPLWRPRTGPVAPAMVSDARALARLGDSLLVGRAPPAIARLSRDAPTADELEVLAAASRRAPLFAALPDDEGSIEAEAPARALSGRAAAVAFRLRAGANDSVLVRLSDETGVLDSVHVRTDAAGRAAAAFRVRPPRAGWREWTVQADGRTARTGAWVDSAGAPRVLVRAGMPHWESKFTVRSLEESGAPVETAFELGRGNVVAAGGGAVTSARLVNVDAVVVLDAAPLGDGERQALAEWAASRGGGVLVAGGQSAAGAFGVVSGEGRTGAIDAPALEWTLPAELAPLPGDRLRTHAEMFASVRPGAALAASADGGGVLALRPLGRGRAASLALTETWRWRMEAGRVEEHREFWRGLADWLASAPRDPLAISIPEPVAPAGALREVVVYAGADAPAAVPPLVVARPGRARDTLTLAPDPARPGVYRTSFVPADTGLYTLAFAGRTPSAGLRATTAAGPAEDAWARLSMLASASGGRMLPADSVRAAAIRLAPEGARGGPGLPLAALLFAALLLAAGAEWAIRRLRGDP